VLIIPHCKKLRCYATFHKTSNWDCSFGTTYAVEIKEVEWGGMDWIDLAKDRYRWRALVNPVMNLRVPLNVVNCLTI